MHRTCRDSGLKWAVVAIFLVLSSGYAGYPYFTLWRLDTAVRQADSATLRTLVDWYSVREGLKEDLCDLPAADTPENQACAGLAPFGASFVRGVTGNMLDKTVTPETLVSMSRAGHGQSDPSTHVVWAFFSNPTQFDVDVRAKGNVQPIRMVMELRNMRWRVRRVWLPDDMLERANSGM